MAKLKKKKATKTPRAGDDLAALARALPKTATTGVEQLSPDELDKLRRVVRSKARHGADELGAGKRDTPTARPKPVKTSVDSPTVPGAVEHLDRVAHTLEHMRRAGQLSERQWRAAELFRNAWEALGGAIGGAMDFDRARGGGSVGAPPSEAQFAAAELVRLVSGMLYTEDYMVLCLIAGEGHSVSAASVLLHGAEPTRAHKEEVGRRLREALNQVAERFISDTPPNPRPRVHRPPDAVPSGSAAEVISPARVAHAGPHQVNYSEGSGLLPPRGPRQYRRHAR